MMSTGPFAYLVVGTGDWLKGGEVLVPLSAPRAAELLQMPDQIADRFVTDGVNEAVDVYATDIAG